MIIEDTEAITKATLVRIIFSQNFSSRDEVTEISGRGFGLDIVKDAISD